MAGLGAESPSDNRIGCCVLSLLSSFKLPLEMDGVGIIQSKMYFEYLKLKQG
jgi:hypothetical protein